MVTYVACKTLILLHESFILLIDFKNFADTIGCRFRLKAFNRKLITCILHLPLHNHKQQQHSAKKEAGKNCVEWLIIRDTFNKPFELH
jgi:hypothetical protein